MTRRAAPRVALAPTEAPRWMAESVEAGGGHVVATDEAEALIWGSPVGADQLADLLQAHQGIRWVQLPWAGIEHFAHLVTDDRTWTCGKGVYAEPVAELALTLGLAGLRNLKPFAAATRWGAQGGRNLLNGRVTVVGGGGITESLLRLLAPFHAHVTVVRNRVQAMEGADEVVGADSLHDALPGADLVVLALALTAETEGLVAAPELSLMDPHAWLVNVARGRHVDTDDLVAALEAGTIGGAGLDVTDPEPLPPGHRLWALPNCIITPHTSNTAEMARPLLADRIAANVRRWVQGDELIGLVDAELGY